MNIRYVVLLMLFLSTVCRASILVSPMLVNFDKNDLTKDFYVENRSNNIEYVKITSFMVKHPGEKNRQLCKIDDPKKLGILITPLKFILPAKQGKFVRIILLKHNSKNELVYLIRVQPTVGDLHMVKGPKNKVSVGLKVIVGYAIKTTVAPINPRPDISIARVGKNITVKNTGNVGVYVIDGEQCLGGKCYKLKDKNKLYANNVWKFMVPHAAPVRFKMLYYNHSEKTIKSN